MDEWEGMQRIHPIHDKEKTDFLGFIDIDKYDQTQAEYYKKNLNLYAEVYLTLEKNRNYIREISDKERNP